MEQPPSSFQFQSRTLPMSFSVVLTTELGARRAWNGVARIERGRPAREN